ncbi:unnamed protein product, partial [Didymodactylos carnosus]
CHTVTQSFGIFKSGYHECTSQCVIPLSIKFEHVIHDCGSTDRTKEYFEINLPMKNILYIQDQGDNKEATKDRKIVRATKDKRKGELTENIIYIRSEHKVPPSQVRNICIRQAQGQFICVLDPFKADDS